MVRNRTRDEDPVCPPLRWGDAMLKPVRLIPALILLMLAALSSVRQTNTSGIGVRVAHSKDATRPGVTTTVINKATGLSQRRLRLMSASMRFPGFPWKPTQ